MVGFCRVKGVYVAENRFFDVPKISGNCIKKRKHLTLFKSGGKILTNKKGEREMTIEEFKKIKIEAMKNHDKDAVSVLNVLINKLMLESIERKVQGAETTEADVTRIIQKTINELREEREGFLRAGRSETVESLTRQLETAEKFLPKMLSPEEIKEVILSLPDKSVPFVMKHFKVQYAGKVDMKTVGEVLKTL